jgi:hypothetical protein
MLNEPTKFHPWSILPGPRIMMYICGPSSHYAEQTKHQDEGDADPLFSRNGGF